MTDQLIITPHTKIGELLDTYPELEDKLIEIAPTFKKLKNPVLRKTIAKVTTLKQAALVGGVSLEDMINTLRKEIGQDTIEGLEIGDGNSAKKPSWMDESKISKTLDARESIANGEHPLGQVMKEVTELQSDQIYELVTPFLPAPMLEKVQAQGFGIWSIEVSDNYYRNFFYRV